MRVSDFNYSLPQELIAQEPLADRSASRMLHVNRNSGDFEDRAFRDLPKLLRSDDLILFNNTRVFPARLYGHRRGSHAQPMPSPRNPAAREFLQGRVEALLVRRTRDADNTWEALVRPGRKIGVGERLTFGESGELQAEVIGRGEFGERTLRFDSVEDFWGTLECIGHVPLPPYIDRTDAASDRERYQTVFSRERGSVAAPTAGLHFTPAILDAIHTRGIETAELTLHVGLGTFQPIHEETVEDHKLHSEWYQVSQETATKVNRALDGNRRVVAVGTTAVRTLEHAAAATGLLQAGSGETQLFIYPGFQFRVVGAMLTNFHLPQSTLLMLVCAFGGSDHILNAYRHAVEERYRFYSYGDCMLIE